jgi:hypothetical protein
LDGLTLDGPKTTLEIAAFMLLWGFAKTIAKGRVAVGNAAQHLVIVLPRIGMAN